jgi:hypothetical protein
MSLLYVLPQPRSLDRAVTFATFLSAEGLTDPASVRQNAMPVALEPATHNKW